MAGAGEVSRQGGTVHVVTYAEVIAASAGEVAARLRDHAGHCRAVDGNEGCEALAETGRPERFAILEAWRDAAACDAAPIGALREALAPLLAAPLDRRVSLGFDVVAPAATGVDAGAVQILTHVDVVPPVKDEGLALLVALARDSRREPGIRRLDVLQQDNRANHLTLVEAWADAAALAAHRAAGHTRAFRERIGPLMGALYDERIYRALR